MAITRICNQAWEGTLSPERPWALQLGVPRS